MTTRTNHLTSPAAEATPAALAALDQAYRDRMGACLCPSCIPPRVSGVGR